MSSLGTTYTLLGVANLIINLCNEVGRERFFCQLIFTDSGYNYVTAVQLPCYMESSVDMYLSDEFRMLHFPIKETP